MFFADSLGPAFPKRAGAALYQFVLQKAGKRDTISRDEARKFVAEYLKSTNDAMPPEQGVNYLVGGGRLVVKDAKTFTLVR